jgi:hypothetical protein
MRRFFLARITGMGCEGVIEGFKVDILGMRRKMRLHRHRQIFVASIGHDCLPRPR